MRLRLGLEWGYFGVGGDKSRGEEARQMGRMEGKDSLQKLASKAPDAVELVALADVSQFLSGVGCS